MEGAAVLVAGAALAVGSIAAIVAPLLYVKRLVLHIRCVGPTGAPLAGIAVRGIRNRQAGASGSGRGNRSPGSTYAVEDRLGVTDSSGSFVATYYLRSFHTLLFNGSQPTFVDSLRPVMSAAKPAVIVVTGKKDAASAADPFDFAGRRFQS